MIFMLILSKIFNPSSLPVYVILVFTLLGRIYCMLLFIDLLIFLPFGPAYGNIRDCNLSLSPSNVPNWFVEIVSVLMVSFTVSIT